jgi:hypothetical protein
MPYSNACVAVHGGVCAADQTDEVTDVMWGYFGVKLSEDHVEYFLIYSHHVIYFSAPKFRGLWYYICDRSLGLAHG